MEVAGNFCIVQELFEYNINSLHGAIAKKHLTVDLEVDSSSLKRVKYLIL